MKSKKQSVNFDLPLSDSVRGKSTVDGLSHRACFRGPRRAELAAPFDPALQAAAAEQPSKVGRRASATAQQIPKSRFKSPGPIVQTTGNSTSSPSRRLGASCGLKF